MEDYLEQIKGAVDANLYYLALSGALVIPDMCAGLESSDGKSTGPRYKAWVDKYLAPKYIMQGMGPSFRGVDCWGLRCSLLHQGRMTPHQGGYSRIVFLEPGLAHGNVFHNNILNDALNLDIPFFVQTMLMAASEWLLEAQQTEEYKTNLENFMHRYPNGLSPYIVGLPVIA